MTRVLVRPTAKTRKRRRRRRLFSLLAYTVVVFGLAWFFESQGTTTIIFVRHADIDGPVGADSDPPLSTVGRARAELLAGTLEKIDVDAGVNAIYVSANRRTRETAAPLAKRLGITPEDADANDVVGFMKTVLFEHKREIVLIVADADAIAPLVEELHGSKNIAEIAEDDHNDLIIVTIPWFGKVKTLQLEYAAGWSPAAG